MRVPGLVKAAAAAVGLLAAVTSTIVAAPPLGASPAAGGEGGWHVVDGDFVVHQDAMAPPVPGSFAAAVPGSGPGYTTLQDQQNIGAFTFQIEVDAEAYRDEVVAAAAELNAILGALGGSFTVEAGNIDLTPEQIADPTPGDGVIVIVESTTSPCAASSPSWIGCAGPRGFEDVSGLGDFYIDRGAVWLRDTLAGFDATVQRETVFHEIGHALGLNHFNTEFEGEFQVMRSGAGLPGAATSYRAGDQNGLRAQHPFPVANDAFADPAVLGPESPSTGRAITRFGSAQVDEPAHGGVVALGSVWFTFTAPRSGWTTITTEQPNFDSRLAVYTGDAIDALTLVGQNDNGPGAGPGSSVGFDAVQGSTYRVAVDGKVGSVGGARVQVRPPSTVPCDDVSTACLIPADGVRVQPRVPTNTTAEPGEPDHSGVDQNFLGTMWFAWTAPRTGTARVFADRPGFAPYLGIYSGANIAALAAVPATLSLTQTSRRLEFATTAGTTYRIAVVDNAVGADGNPFELSVDPGFGGYTPLVPARIQDSRAASSATNLGGRWGTGTSRVLDVTGVGGVPDSGVSAVVLNVTVADAAGAGFLTLDPTGQDRPTASNLNFVAGQTVPNLVTVKVGLDGKVDIFASSGLPHVIADVVGWYGPASGELLTPVAPARIQESRSGPGITQMGAAGPWAAQQTRNVQVTGLAGIPSGATAVVLNITATGTTASGFLTVWPADDDRPTASNLNWVSGQTVPNLVTVGLSPTGQVSVFNHAGDVDVIADVVGYYGGGGGAAVTPVTPVRLLDTRSPGAIGLTGAFAAGVPRTLPVSGPIVGTATTSPVPAGATGVLLNVTVTEPSAPSFLTAFPAGQARPNASNLNFVAGQTVPNLVLVKVGPDGVVLFNNSGSTHVIADVVGYVGA